MKIVFVSDIHSNYNALKNVMDKLDNISYDKFVCLGDIVGYGPSPKKCLDLIKKEADICIQGNHDRMVCNEIDSRLPDRVKKGLKHSKNRLAEDDIDWLDSLDEKMRYKNLLLAHSHPEITDKYVKPISFSSMYKYMDDDIDILALGHTHIQDEEMIDKGLVFNPGSVGQPRDRNNKSGFAVVESENKNIENYRVDYNIDKVVNKIDNISVLPRKNGTRLYIGK